MRQLHASCFLPQLCIVVIETLLLLPSFLGPEAGARDTSEYRQKKRPKLVSLYRGFAVSSPTSCALYLTLIIIIIIRLNSNRINCVHPNNYSRIFLPIIPLYYNPYSALPTCSHAPGECTSDERAANRSTCTLYVLQQIASANSVGLVYSITVIYRPVR